MAKSEELFNLIMFNMSPTERMVIYEHFRKEHAAHLKSFADRVREEIKSSLPHRVGSHSDDYGGDADAPCFCCIVTSLTKLEEEYGIRREK